MQTVDHTGGAIYAKRKHVYQVDTLSMMLTTDQWIPLEGLHELPLIEALQRCKPHNGHS